MPPAALLLVAIAAAVAIAACGEDEARRAEPVSPASVASSAQATAAEAPPAPVARAATARRTAASTGLLRGRTTRLNGEADDLAQYGGKVVLVVNTASECVNTPQYGQLEALYRARKSAGFVVLGFPANDFGAQEPGTDEQIAAFCKQNFGVSFPMFAKGVVTGDRALPLYRRLSEASEPPSCNFTKYLLDRRGRLVQRFDPYLPADAPQVRRAIDRLLRSGAGSGRG